MAENRSIRNELQQKVNLILSTYYNLYGHMPSTKELSSQLGYPYEIHIKEWIDRYTGAMSAMAC